ncbi:MAG: hypothetical protein WBG57_11610 [Ornithinimicrobium sp.]
MDRTLSTVAALIVVAAVATVTTSSGDTVARSLDEADAGGQVGAVGMAVPGHSGASGGSVYAVHGAPGRHLDVEIDGEWLARVGTAEVAGPYALDPGSSTVAFIDPEGDQVTSSTIEVAEDSSSDVVVHWPEQGGSERVITTFDNDVTPVAADKTSVMMANTAALSRADVAMDDDVLFERLANGEFLDLVVPEGTYDAQVLSDGEWAPVMPHPERVELDGGTSQRVYAIGDPRDGTVTFASHTLSAPGSGSPIPETVNTGTGGLFENGRRVER